jgi:hypothetical protein
MSYRAGEPELRVLLTPSELDALCIATACFVDLDHALAQFYTSDKPALPQAKLLKSATEKLLARRGHIQPKLEETRAVAAPTPDAVARILKNARLITGKR